MGKTSIEWVVNPDGTQGESLNPIRGTKGNWHCSKAGTDCLNCYAERLNIRWSGPPFGAGEDTFRLDTKALVQPLRWRKPRSVFMCDMTDLFHSGISDTWRALIFGIMSATPQHRYYILTKRPELALEWFKWLDRKASMGYHRSFLVWQLCEARINYPRPLGLQSAWPLPNVWVGISAGTQQLLDERMKHLVQIPAAHRFVSLEPLLELVDAGPWLNMLDWLIMGCESGSGRRPCDSFWIDWVLGQRGVASIPMFVKQIQVAGRVSQQMDEWPERLQIRELPHETNAQS
jgi:protein gp37